MKELLKSDWPIFAKIGLPCTGPGVGIEALASPIWDQTIDPPFKTNSGFTPKNEGFHKAKSAILPFSIEPTYLLIPWAIAGLIVTLEIYRLNLKLSFLSES